MASILVLNSCQVKNSGAIKEYTVEDIEYPGGIDRLAVIKTAEGEELSYPIGWVRDMNLRPGEKFSRPIERKDVPKTLGCFTVVEKKRVTVLWIR